MMWAAECVCALAHTCACEWLSVGVFLVNFNSLVQLDFRGVFHTFVLALNLCSLVCFFPIKFNLKLNTQYVSCRSLNGKSQVRDREYRDREGGRGIFEIKWDVMLQVGGWGWGCFEMPAPPVCIYFCLTIMSMYFHQRAGVKTCNMWMEPSHPHYGDFYKFLVVLISCF